MKLKPKHKLKPVVLTVFILSSIWMLTLSEMYRFFVPDAMIGIQAALASSPYGILGQAAPELNLNTWIDGNGNPIEPIRLNDYIGKVVYLYFFQDW
ncbi:MAG: hypothetical protein JSW04_07765 [Desulfobacterales bacterium]|nr:MAG: hypothetical protein JSW04_07765 [Desulfobacterales bacterium]